MPTDKLILPLKGIFGGISPLPPTQQPEAVVADLMDQRCGDSFERVVFEHLGDTAELTTGLRYLDYLGTAYKLRADSYAYMGDQLFYRDGSDDRILSAEGVQAVELPAPGYRFTSMRGSVAYLGWPGPTCCYLTEPGAMPAFNTPGNPVPSKMVFQQHNSSAIYGVQGFGQGMVVFGARAVSYWDFNLSRQNVLSTAGCLSDYAWAGSDNVVWWIGQDYVLYSFDGKQVQPLGYAWLFKQHTRAFLTWLEPTKDLFITLDAGDGAELVSADTYLYHSGLTRLSTLVFQPDLGLDAIYGIGDQGQTVKVNYPARSQGAVFNWLTYSTPSNLLLPNRPADLTLSWADFYSSQVKSFLALETISSPTWPTYFRVTSDTGAVDIGINTLEFPVGEVNVSGHKFLVEVWFASPDAGPVRITNIRTHIQAEDLRGIYAAATGQPTLNG